MYLFGELLRVSSLVARHEGQEISGPYLHSRSGLPVRQLWSGRNDKHYRRAEVTEGAEPELLLFSPQMGLLVSVGAGHIRAAAAAWEASGEASCTFLTAAHQPDQSIS